MGFRQQPLLDGRRHGIDIDDHGSSDEERNQTAEVYGTWPTSVNGTDANGASAAEKRTEEDHEADADGDVDDAPDLQAFPSFDSLDALLLAQ